MVEASIHVGHEFQCEVQERGLDWLGMIEVSIVKLGFPSLPLRSAEYFMLPQIEIRYTAHEKRNVLAENQALELHALQPHVDGHGSM